ncbi:penicillin-binding protein [uncultured Cytophaga sp.]|uniref:penicillin-binding protein n=1 Tax=uncultured Cytophaga sp. TaxID=160238 RepID=UPI0026276C90|nr:penicillin-binding protein [uncultured Cytophaga sp.]
MNIKKSIVLRIRIAFLVILLFSFAIGYKIVSIQFLKSERWAKLHEENLLDFKDVKPTRGNIFSADGSLLATSLPFYRVCIDPTIADNDTYRKGIDKLAINLQNYYKDKTASEYKRKINDARRGNKRYIILNHKLINYQDKKLMSEWPIFSEGRSRGGIVFEKVDKRFMPFSFLAQRTVGFVNEENNGAGLEYSFNKELAGKNGKALFRKMSGGNWKPVHDENEIMPVDGIDIVTTIDINIQDVAEASLRNHLAAHDADYGCVVLMEVATGEIKAIANLGKVGEGRYAENYNYAMGNQGLTEPGSTFKLASVIALFEDTDINLADTIDTGNGEYEFYDRVMRDSKPGGYGKITLQQAFEKSSNIAISKKVNEYFGAKPEKFLEYIRNMGLTEPVVFQMDGVAKPYFKSTASKTWSGTTLPWMSIGYELSMSPIHTLSFYNGVANNGKMVRPMIVKQTRVADHILDSYETEVVVDRMCSDETLRKVKIMLEGVVENGTASNIKNVNYKIAGKTGTAQRLVKQSYTRTYYTSFVGYFPADRPKYSCIVVIDNPKGYNLYGSDVAAPVFKEVADKIFAQDLELHKPMVEKIMENPGIYPAIKGGLFDDMKYLCDELKIPHHKSSNANDDWVVSHLENKTVIWYDRKIVTGIVPNVNGLKLKDALYVLENIGLHVNYQGSGRVVSQSITAGTRYNKGNHITLVLN